MYRFTLLFLLVGVIRVQSHAQTTVAIIKQDSQAGVGEPSKPASAKKVYAVADEMPSFPGGDAALAVFLRTKLQYPEEALNKDVSGKVYVSFVVDERGHLQDIKIAKGLGAGLDQEALRLVRIMPWWNPGKINKEAVAVTYTMPIVFRAL